MSLARTLLGLIPDDSLRRALAVWDRWAPVVAENRAAVDVARMELDRSGNPIAAVRVFAASTTTPLDDAAVAELEAGVRLVIGLLDRVCAVAVAVSEHEPAIRDGVDAALKGVFGVAYEAARWRHRLRSWQA